MALISIEDVAPGVSMGLWRIEETAEELAGLDDALREVYDATADYGSESRRREKLAVYALLFRMTGNHALRIDHESRRKPVVAGWHISISHTRGFAAVMLSRTAYVGIDVEYRSDRVSRIVSKFIRPDESAPDVVSQLIHWCAKEAVYKLFSDEDLQYFEMRLLPFQVASSDTVTVQDLKVSKSQPLSYVVTPEYVLAYTWKEQ